MILISPSIPRCLTPVALVLMPSHPISPPVDVQFGLDRIFLTCSSESDRRAFVFRDARLEPEGSIIIVKLGLDQLPS